MPTPTKPKTAVAISDAITAAVNALLGRPKPVPIGQMRQALPALAEDARRATEHVSDLKRKLGAAALENYGRDDAAELAELDAAIRAADRARDRHEAGAKLLREAEAAEAQKALSARWADASDKVEQRNAAGVRAQAAADVLAREMRTILKLEAEIAGAVPVPGWAPMGWAGGLLEQLVQRYLAGIVPPCFAKSRGLSSLPEVQAVTLADAIRSSGEQMMAKAPTNTHPAATAASTTKGA